MVQFAHIGTCFGPFGNSDSHFSETKCNKIPSCEKLMVHFGYFVRNRFLRGDEGEAK